MDGRCVLKKDIHKKGSTEKRRYDTNISMISPFVPYGIQPRASNWKVMLYRIATVNEKKLSKNSWSCKALYGQPIFDWCDLIFNFFHFNFAGAHKIFGFSFFVGEPNGFLHRLSIECISSKLMIKTTLFYPSCISFFLIDIS